MFEYEYRIQNSLVERSTSFQDLEVVFDHRFMNHMYLKISGAVGAYGFLMMIGNCRSFKWDRRSSIPAFFGIVTKQFTPKTLKEKQFWKFSAFKIDDEYPVRGIGNVL